MYRNILIVSLSLVLIHYNNNVLVECMEIPEEAKEIAQQLHTACQAETGVPEDLIVNCRNGNFADDPKLKCYMKCIMENLAIIDDDGIVDAEAMIGIMPANIVPLMEGTIRGCGTVVGSDACDNAFLTHKCYYEKNPEYFFLP